MGWGEGRGREQADERSEFALSQSEAISRRESQVQPAAQPALARRIARAAGALSFERLAPEVTAKVKIGLLDMLSCAFEARTLPWGEQAIRMARRASGRATIIGTPFRSAAGEAAFANAVLGHGLVREDMHTAAVSHLGVVIYPVLMALAEEANRPVSGRDFIVAAMCGYEVGAAIGRAIMDSDLVRRIRPTGITGPLAGAMAGSRLLSLDEGATVSALGLAANATGGLNEWPYSGGDEMFFHPGFAARSAVTAVELAALGTRASETALDGTSGLFASVGKRDRITAVAPFSGEPEILSVYYKPAPACNYAQTACQAAARLHVPHSTDIAGITVKLPAAAIEYPGCNYAGPFERALQAKMSVQYCVAAALVCGGIEEANYRRLSDPEITRLAHSTTLESDRTLTAAYPGAQGAEIIVNLRNGDALRQRLDNVIPASPSEIHARFRAAAGWRAAEIESCIGALEHQQTLTGLTSLLGA
jgi:2-methylcitrate dehydratase PrpD